MFTIFDGRNSFYQWDLNQKLIIEDNTIDEVHFCNRTDDCALVCRVYAENGLRVVNVPNILLQDSWDVRAYGYCGNRYTKQEARFKVLARSKPADYIYTETEKVTVKELIAEGFEEAKANGDFKGDKGDKGDTGAVKMIPVTELPKTNIDETAIYLKPIANWIGGSGIWINGATTITTTGFNDVVDDIKYFRIVLKKQDNSSITIKDAENALTFVTTDGETVHPKMTKGTIDNGTIHNGTTNRAYTTDLQFISNYKEVTLIKGWSMWAHFYNGDKFEEYVYINGAWELIGAAGVEVNLEGYIKNTDIANKTTFGIVKVTNGDNGIGHNEAAGLYLATANNSQIDKKENQYRPITPKYIDYAIKTGVTTNTIGLTASEVKNASNWLGYRRKLETIASYTVEEDATNFSINATNDGYSFSLDEILVTVDMTQTNIAASTSFYFYLGELSGKVMTGISGYNSFVFSWDRDRAIASYERYIYTAKEFKTKIISFTNDDLIMDRFRIVNYDGGVIPAGTKITIKGVRA